MKTSVVVVEAKHNIFTPRPTSYFHHLQPLTDVTLTALYFPKRPQGIHGWKVVGAGFKSSQDWKNGGTNMGVLTRRELKVMAVNKM